MIMRDLELSIFFKKIRVAVQNKYFVSIEPTEINIEKIQIIIQFNKITRIVIFSREHDSYAFKTNILYFFVRVFI